MNLIRTGVLNGIAVAIRTLTALVVSKIIAVYAGPGGYAVIGQLQNFVTMMTTLGSGAMNTGVTKYVAEYKEEHKQYAITQTGMSILLLFVTASSVILILFSGQISGLLFDGQDYEFSIQLLAATLFLFALNAFLLAVLNGRKEIRKYVAVNIVTSVLSLIYTGGLTYFWGLHGALIAIVTNQSIIICVTLYFVIQSSWFRWRMLFPRFRIPEFKNLSKYVAMAAISALVVPIGQILIRDHLATTIGWNYAGLWEAMNRISGMYLMMVSTTLVIYFVPKFSELKTRVEINNELVYAYKLILPAIACICVGLYIFRDFITLILFSKDFFEMRDLYLWQLIGDFIKTISWLMGCLLAAKAMWKEHIFSQIFFTVLLYALTVVFTRLIGFEGAALAYALNYAGHAIFMYVILAKRNVIGPGWKV